MPSRKALSPGLLWLPKFIMLHKWGWVTKTNRRSPSLGIFYFLFQLAVYLAVWTAVAFVWYGSRVHQTGEWPRTAPRMTALSSCEKAGKKKKLRKTYYEVKAIIIQRVLTSSAPIRGGWVDRGASQRKRSRSPLSWIISAWRWSASSILAGCGVRMIQHLFLRDKPPRYPDIT